MESRVAGMEKPENRRKAKRGPPPGTRTSPRTEFPPGVSGNPTGAPRKGMSHAEILRTIDDWTVEQAIAFLDVCGAEPKNPLRVTLSKYPRNVALRHLGVLTARIAAMESPSPAWFDALANRTDGKIPDRTDGTLRLTIGGLPPMPED